MHAHERGFNGISNNDNVPPAPTRKTGYRIAAVIIVLAMILIGAAQWGQPDRDADRNAGRNGISSAAEENRNVSTEFVYFPGQYVNQAKDPEEHIKAF